MDRGEVDHLQRELYAARKRGDLDWVCRAFTEDDEIGAVPGANHGIRVTVDAKWVNEVRSGVALMIKTLEVGALGIVDYAIREQPGRVRE